MDKSNTDFEGSDQPQRIQPSTTVVKDKGIKTTSRLAIAAIMCIPAAVAFVLVSGFLTFVGTHDIAGLFVAGAVLSFCGAFVLGLISIAVIAIRHKQFKGEFWAILAIVLSALPMYFICSIWMGARARAEVEKANVGTYNLRLLGRSLVAYAENHQGQLPASDRWCDLLIEDNSKLTGDNFRHPKPKRLQLTGTCHFAFNRNLSGLRLADIPDDVVLLFESDGDWNLNGTSELLRTRHKAEASNVAMLFADQTIGTYWYYLEGVRKFDSKGRRMYHKKPRWKP